jgi:hypothetical protein
MEGVSSVAAVLFQREDNGAMLESGSSGSCMEVEALEACHDKATRMGSNRAMAHQRGGAGGGTAAAQRCSGVGEGTLTALRAAPLLGGSSRSIRGNEELVRQAAHRSD